MKTQILRLEPHDDAVSVRDKMNWIQTRRILLVWPEHTDILSRKIDLVLLHRQSIKQGAQLAIISSHPQIRDHARELNIPYFTDLNKAQRARWHTDRRYRAQLRKHTLSSREYQIDKLRDRFQDHSSHTKWMDKAAYRVLIFTFGVLSILSVAGILFPSAKITLSPQSSIQEIEIDVRASLEVNEINLSGAIPARQLSVIVKGRDSIPTTGMTQTPQDFASGLVLATNLTDKEIIINEGTIIRSNTDKSIRFIVTRSGKLPAQVGASISLNVRALFPGLSGNLPKDSLTIIEVPHNQSVAISNPLPTRGGTEISLPSPSQEDQEKLYGQLEQSLLISATKQAQNQIQPQDLIVENSIAINQVLEKEIDPDISQPSEQITMLMRLEYKILVVSGDDIYALADGVQNTSLPSGFSIIPGTTKVIHITKPTLGPDNYIRWRLSTQSDTQAKISEQAIIRLVQGAPIQNIRDIISSQIHLEEPAQISITPGWWPRIPFLPFRISITYAH